MIWKIFIAVNRLFMVRTGLEKSWNLTLDLKSHGILCWPGKMAFCLEKSLKTSGSHWKISCAMLNLIWTWKHRWLYDKKPVSLCHHIWDHIGETMLADLHSWATCYIVADSWTTCYIVAVKPCQAAYAGKVSMIKAPLHLTVSGGVLVGQKTTSYREKSNRYEANLSSINSANMYVWWWCSLSSGWFSIAVCDSVSVQGYS